MSMSDEIKNDGKTEIIEMEKERKKINSEIGDTEKELKKVLAEKTGREDIVKKLTLKIEDLLTLLSEKEKPATPPAMPEKITERKYPKFFEWDK